MNKIDWTESEIKKTLKRVKRWNKWGMTTEVFSGWDEFKKAIRGLQNLEEVSREENSNLHKLAKLYSNTLIEQFRIYKKHSHEMIHHESRFCINTEAEVVEVVPHFSKCFIWTLRTTLKFISMLKSCETFDYDLAKQQIESVREFAASKHPMILT